MSNNSEFLCETPVSIHFVKDNLIRCCAPNENNLTLKSWKAELIGEGKGFVSYMVKVTLNWSKNLEKLPKSVVVKVPTGQKIQEMQDSMDSQMDFNSYVPHFHKTECRFYGLWDNEPPPLKIPRHFFSQEMVPGKIGALILEDLSVKGTQVLIGDGLNLPQLIEIAENLASLHAWCLRNPKWMDVFEPIPDGFFDAIPPMSKVMFNEMREMYPDYFVPLLDPMVDMYTTVEDVSYHLRVHEEFHIPPVFAHGDFWIGNMMFIKTTDTNGMSMASNELQAIFDWQTCFKGTAAFDFGRLMFVSMDGEFRRENQEIILRQYYESLKQKLGKEPPFTFDILMKTYYRIMKAVFMGAFGAFWLMLKTDVNIFGGEKYKERILLRGKCMAEDTLASLKK